MGLENINHIVVLMLENRSFDSMLGDLYPDDAEKIDGVDLNRSNQAANREIYPVWSSTDTDDVSMSIPDPDPGEEFTDINTQLFGTPSGPATAATKASMSGFVQNYMTQTASPAADYVAKAPMHFYTNAQIPVLTGLAQAFGVSDRWHASAPCQTWPNRFFVHTATANGYVNNDPPHFPYDMPTIYNQLGKAGQDWKVYFHDIPQSLTLAELWPQAGNFHLFPQFQVDAEAGTLPAYSFIEPRYFADMGMPSDQHPPHVVTLGEQLIAAVYNAVRNGKGWQNTLLIITYDEHGGIYDHVPPPPATPPGHATAPFNFDRFGVRVPAVIISPYIAPGSVIRPAGATPFDHTSIIATLRERFGLPAPLTQRDGAAPSLAAALNLSGPTNDGPNSIVAQPYAASPAATANAAAAPLNSHQKALLQIAAHLPSTAATGDFGAFISSFLDHLRAGATGTDVSAIQDVSSALIFIKSRLGNLFKSL